MSFRRNRYKVECVLCKERFDNDYTKRHTNLKHPELEQQNRVVPVLEMGVKKRKNPWEIVVSKVPRHDDGESIDILQASSAKGK